MTESIRKKQSAAKASRKPTAKAAWDAYDDFLELTESAPAKKATSSRGQKAAKATSAAKRTSVPRKATSTSGTARKKTASSGRKKPVESYSGDLAAVWQELADASPTRAASGAGVRRTRKADAEPTRRTTARPANGSRKVAGRPSSAGARKVSSRPRKNQALLLVENSPQRDPFDEYLDATEGKRSGGERKRGKGSGVTAVLIAAIVCVIGLAGWQAVRYGRFLEMKSAVEHQGFYEGTTVEGIDVSGMTLAEALERWETQIEPGYAQRTVTLSNGAAFTAAELGYTSDYATVLNNAWSAGRSGSLEERYQMISSRKEQPVSYEVTRTLYSAETIEQCVAAIAQQIDRPAENAKIASFDTSTYQFTFTDEVVGSKLDTQALATDMAGALDAGGGTVELKVQSIQPSVKKADISSQYGMIASAVTNASSSSSNRLTNIRLALELINGTCLEPGETFSFNTVVGKRTTDRGFKVATAYSSGEVTEEVGGGICQVSTTLFNAAVKADLEIVERHNHSLTVGYVDLGKDASVNWNSQDLRFTNNTDDNVYICCLLSDDKRVRVAVFGKLLPNGEYITVEGETTGTIAYDTVYQPNLSYPSGVSQVTRSGKNGYTAVAYKIRWDANGNQISSELLCKSTYKATSEIVEYGP